MAIFITGCGTNTSDDSKNQTELNPEISFEDIEYKDDETAINTIIDTTTSDGDSINVDPKFYDINGKQVKLSDFKGKPVVLNFWASWCVPCQYEFKDFQKSYEKYGEEVQFVMIDLIGVQNETEAKGKKYIVDNNYTFPTYYDSDGEVFYSLVIKQIPTTIFINKDGTIQNKDIGLINEDELNENIKLLIENNY